MIEYELVKAHDDPPEHGELSSERLTEEEILEILRGMEEGGGKPPDDPTSTGGSTGEPFETNGHGDPSTADMKALLRREPEQTWDDLSPLIEDDIQNMTKMEMFKAFGLTKDRRVDPEGPMPKQHRGAYLGGGWIDRRRMGRKPSNLKAISRKSPMHLEGLSREDLLQLISEGRSTDFPYLDPRKKPHEHETLPSQEGENMTKMQMFEAFMGR